MDRTQGQQRHRTLAIPLLAGFALAIVLTALSCGGEQQATAPPRSDPERENPDRGRWVDLAPRHFKPEWVGGTLTIARAAPPDTLNNLLWTSGDAKVLAEHFLHPSLLRTAPDAVDGELAIEPQVAVSLPEISDDHLVHTWRIRDDLSWDDGTPLTAHDYAFSWKLIQDPAIRCATRRASLEDVESVTALDDHRFRVTWKRPYYRAVLAFGTEFTVVPRHQVPEEPEAFNKLDRHASYGAYRLAHFDQNRLELELRPEYRTKPFPIFPRYVERVVYTFRGSGGSNIDLLKSGLTDVAVIGHDDFDALDHDAAFNRVAWKTFYFLPQWAFIAWNGTDRGDLDRPHPLFGDARVRRAMSHLIDRAWICREYFHERAVPVSGPAFFKDPDYDREVVPPAFDPARARELLTEAGWKLASSGVLEKEGREFRFTFLYPAGISWAEKIATFVQESFRKHGILMEVGPLGDLAQTVYPKKYDAFLLRFDLRPPIEIDFYPLFHSEESRKPGMNFVGMADPGIDAIIDAYRSEFDPARRLELRRSLHRPLDAYHPYSFLFCIGSCVGVSRKWANVKVHDRGIWYRDFVLRELWERYPPR